MNRTLLLENLPDLLEDLDARLTALENNKPNERDWEAAANSALAQLTFSRKNVNWLRDTLDAAQDKIERLLAENRRLTDGFYALEAQRRALTAELSAMKQRRDALAAELGDRIKERKTIWAEVDDLKAQRNALAAQLDDLRNVNAGLRQDNASQQALLVSGRLRSLRRIEAIFAVEWVTGECPWCGNSHREGHADDCQRQAALR